MDDLLFYILFKSISVISEQWQGDNSIRKWVASTCYLVFKVVAKLTYLVAIIGGHVTAKLPHIVRFMIKQNSIWSKALIMPLTTWNCVLSYKKKNYFSENWLVLPRNYFRTEFTGSDFLLPTF